MTVKYAGWRIQWSILMFGIIQSTQIQAATFNNALHSACEKTACLHGSCYLVNSVARCACDDAFSGERCEIVDLTKAKIIVVGRSVVLQWKHPPRITAFTLIYYKIGGTNDISKRSIHMSNADNTLIISDLRGSLAHYRICIENDSVSYGVDISTSVNTFTNCIGIVTTPDYHSAAAWCLLLALVCVILVLIYAQKKKIEILYFHTPAYVPRLLEENLNLTMFNLTQSTADEDDSNIPGEEHPLNSTPR